MKKLMYYVVLMIVVVILLPMLIVKGCGPSVDERKPEKKAEEDKAHKDYKISVYNSQLKKTENVELEEYIKGVLAAEMPADFSIEALKAQAVAARTYAYGRLSRVYIPKEGIHDGVDICTDSTHCQAWISKENARKKWSVFFASRNWSKIEKAVNDTKGMIVVYNGEIANTLFHASSPGRTENSEDVWSGVGVPYLRSVESSGEEASRGYITQVSIKSSELIEKLQKAYPDTVFDDNIYDSTTIVDHTPGGRVRTLMIGDIIMKGTEFRTLLGLRSACFKLEADKNGSEDIIKITTTGHGHGVGMSQYGADSLAKKGGAYKEILEHYYTGVNIISIDEYAKMNS